MRKDNVDLICSIGELAGLFKKSSSLEDFLQTVVSIVAYHMRAAVCSVYLYNDKCPGAGVDRHPGAERDSIGRVRLKLGEGLTGQALKELRPIREGPATAIPSTNSFPASGGALSGLPGCAHHARAGPGGRAGVAGSGADYFDENDTKALQAIAAQLASHH
jgi:phosphotransferase system enzyme I (PtsP)